MNILIDGDACPIKELIIELTAKWDYPVTIVRSVAHCSKSSLASLRVKEITVDNRSEEADMKIFNLAQSGDIVVTQDYGLAALLLEREVKVITPRGRLLTVGNIDYLLAQRHHSAKIRRGGGKTQGPSKYTSQDKNRFKETFVKLVTG
ncbi:MAG: YaiI/YqxD family protein [Bacillota bacterium]